MQMPWTEARDYALALARLRREALLQAAIASRAAQADAAGWRQWLRDVDADT